MGKPAKEQEQAQAVDRERWEAAQFIDQNEHERQGDVFGEVAMSADATLQVVDAARAEIDAVQAATANDADRQSEEDQREGGRVPWHDGRQLSDAPEARRQWRDALVLQELRRSFHSSEPAARRGAVRLQVRSEQARLVYSTPRHAYRICDTVLPVLRICTAVTKECGGQLITALSIAKELAFAPPAPMKTGSATLTSRKAEAGPRLSMREWSVRRSLSSRSTLFASVAY